MVIGKKRNIAKPSQSHCVANLWCIVTLKCYHNWITMSPKIKEFELVRGCLQWAVPVQQSSLTLMSVWGYQKRRKKRLDTLKVLEIPYQYPLPSLIEVSRGAFDFMFLNRVKKLSPGFSYNLFLLIVNICRIKSLWQYTTCLLWHFWYEYVFVVQKANTSGVPANTPTRWF